MKTIMNKLSLIIFAFILFSYNARAQENATYMLPKTAIDIYVTIEESTYTPGEFCEYAESYFKKENVKCNKHKEYTITGIRFNPISVPDTSKVYSVNPTKYNIGKLNLSEDGILLAINSEPAAVRSFVPFESHSTDATLNPKDFMTQEILNAGSKNKMAQLTYYDIADIRESRNQLTRGQADYMPKDGSQLEMMLKNMDLQEKALMSTFLGTTIKDTTEITFRCIPDGEINDHIIFRFSKNYGITDSDDLSGEPYYISIKDLHSTPMIDIDEKTAKHTVMYTVIPGKIQVTIKNKDKELAQFPIYASQFGTLNPLTNELFNKKVTTSVMLNPITGSIESISTRQNE